MEFKFTDFTVIFDNKIKYEIFEELPDYYGIVFKIGGGKIELLHHIYLGYRLLISKAEFYNQDIPFSKKTEFYLEGIEVKWNK